MRAHDELLRAFCNTRVGRRRFLQASASGVVLLGLGALLPNGCSRYPKPAVPLQVLNPREYAMLGVLAERLLGVAGLVGTAPEQVDVGRNVDALVAPLDADLRSQLRSALRVFEHGTYLFDLRRKRFTGLAPEQQEQYLAGWMNSTLGVRRTVFRVLKALVSAGFYQEPRSWPAVGYDGPWLGRIAVDPRGAAEDPVPLDDVLAGRR
jgi:hypothetical protein